MHRLRAGGARASEAGSQGSDYVYDTDKQGAARTRAGGEDHGQRRCEAKGQLRQLSSASAERKGASLQKARIDFND
eukprot:10093812-Heterocapsa_arctica.AAC.1